MHTYTVKVTRDDRWWMIEVPELEGYVNAVGARNYSTITQARRLSEVNSQAIDFICTVTDQAPSAVNVKISVSVDGIDVSARAHKIAEDRKDAERRTAAVQHAAQALARDLANHGVAVRDVGEMLGVSPQRVSQLTNLAIKD